MTFNINDVVYLTKDTMYAKAGTQTRIEKINVTARGETWYTVSFPYIHHKVELKESSLRKESDMDKVKYTFPNGVTVEGTLDQINAVGRALGFAVNIKMYRSSTHGLIPIASMDDTHLRNAILSRYRVWANDLSGIKTGRDLVNAIRSGPSNDEFINLVTEYATRVTNGRIK